MYIIIVGTPVDGLEFYGPFGDEEEAIYWAESRTAKYLSWWIAKVYKAE